MDSDYGLLITIEDAVFLAALYVMFVPAMPVTLNVVLWTFRFSWAPWIEHVPDAPVTHELLPPVLQFPETVAPLTGAFEALWTVAVTVGRQLGPDDVVEPLSPPMWTSTWPPPPAVTVTFLVSPSVALSSSLTVRVTE
jgi:hypothetical protein